MFIMTDNVKMKNASPFLWKTQNELTIINVYAKGVSKNVPIITISRADWDKFASTVSLNLTDDDKFVDQYGYSCTDAYAAFIALGTPINFNRFRNRETWIGLLNLCKKVRPFLEIHSVTHDNDIDYLAILDTIMEGCRNTKRIILTGYSCRHHKVFNFIGNKKIKTVAYRENMISGICNPSEYASRMHIYKVPLFETAVNKNGIVHLLLYESQEMYQFGKEITGELVPHLKPLPLCQSSEDYKVGSLGKKLCPHCHQSMNELTSVAASMYDRDKDVVIAGSAESRGIVG